MILFLDLVVQETDENIEQQVQELKKKVRMTLIAVVEKPSQKLKLIDAIQRLGVSYHFEIEIQEILKQLHNNITLHDLDDHENNDELYDVALLFRLLRQHGFYISCGALLLLLYISLCYPTMERLISPVCMEKKDKSLQEKVSSASTLLWTLKLGY
jgi:hypothetical protein